MKIALTVSGMHCDACVRVIEAALTQMPSVRECTVRLGNVVVTFDDSKGSRADILATIRGAGAFEISDFSTSP